MPVTDQLTPDIIHCEHGLILDEAIHHIDPGAAVELINFEPDIEDGYRRILGYTEYDSNEITATGYTSGAILGLAAAANGKIVACRGTGVVYGSGSGWTEIAGSTTGNARTSAGKYKFDIYKWGGNLKTIMADDGANNYAATYDTVSNTYTLMNGSVGSGSGTAPSAPHDVFEFQGHMFYLQGNTVTFSAPFDENNFTPASGSGQFIIPSDCGGTVKGISRRDKAFIFCQNQIYYIQGSSIADFELRELASNVGCVDGWSVQHFGGDIIFLSSDGLRTISGTDQEDDNTAVATVSKPIQNLIKGLHQSNEDISSVVIRNKSQYRMFYPQSSTTVANAKGITAVKKRNSKSGNAIGWEFSEIKGIKPSYCASAIVSGNEIILHGDYSDGKIYQQESGNTFNGTNIVAAYKSPDIILEDVGLNKTFHRVILNIDNLGTLSLNMRVIYDLDSTDVPQPTIYEITQSNTTSTYGSGTYGTSTYSADVNIELRQPIEGSGFLVALRFTESSGSSPFSIKGFQFEYKENGRR